MWNVTGMFRRYGPRPRGPADAPQPNAGNEPALSSIFPPQPDGLSTPDSVSLPKPGRSTAPPGLPEAADAVSAPESAGHVLPHESQPDDASAADTVPAPESGELGESLEPLFGPGAANPFVEPEQPMSRATETPRDDAAVGETQVRESLPGKVVCPFCGQQKSTAAEPCPRCTMEDTPATRQSTKARIGPWYVLQNRSPSAPGMKYATLVWLVNKGHVTPRSIVRGPTTHQLWRYAAHVRGLSREFGLCYSCGKPVEKNAANCPQCDRSQEPPVNPDLLLEVRTGANGAHPPLLREVEIASEPLRPRRRGVTDSARAEAPIIAPPRSRPTLLVDDHDDVDDHRDHPAAGAGLESGERLSHSERLRARNEQVGRQRQEQFRRGDGRMVSALDLAAALQEPDDTPRSRRWSLLNVLLFLVLLAGGAVAAALYIKPEYRAPAVEWVTQSWESVRDRAAAWQWSSPPGEPPVVSNPGERPGRPEVPPALAATPPAPPVTTDPAPAVAQQPQDRKPQDASARVEQSTTAPPAVAGRPADSQNTQKPQMAGETIAQRRNTDRPADRPRQAETVRQPEQPARTTERPADPPPQAVAGKTVDPIDQSRMLLRNAIDSEAAGDFTAAVGYYEQIKRLPPDVWPGGLQIRLDLARESARVQAAEAR
jgi:hypothetical protein